VIEEEVGAGSDNSRRKLLWTFPKTTPLPLWVEDPVILPYDDLPQTSRHPVPIDKGVSVGSVEGGRAPSKDQGLHDVLVPNYASRVDEL
jgi:hypothetical protein